MATPKTPKAKGLLCEPPKSPYLVPFDGSFRVDKARTRSKDKSTKKENEKALKKAVKDMSDLQRKLYADDRFSVLLVFQAMDAAGKDSTIRAVMTGLNPAGVQVFSFKRPSAEELDHDFLWRVASRAPERGRIGIFNRSHYEEVLVVRVADGVLQGKKLPRAPKDIWRERFESIASFEKHLARNGTLILKFFLNVGRDEQRERLLARLDDPSKNWKFEAGDLAVRAQWGDYMGAYEEALNATSTPWAPWYSIPADDKPFMRRTVAELVHEALEALPLRWPELKPEELAQVSSWRAELAAD